MSLTSEDELYWTIWVVDDLLKTSEVSEEKVSTLVSCETTSETDSQRIRIETIDSLDDLCRVLLLLLEVESNLFLDIIEELSLESLTDLPDFSIISLIDLLPHLRISL